jgi:DNA-binding transcriptional MerR regulator
MSKFTLNDLESLTGIKSDTIRMWERRYNILSPNRTPTNRRWYDDDELKKLINISVIYHNGTKISKIAAMDDEEILERASSFSEGSKTLDSIISSMIIAITQFDENAVNELILKSIISRGFEKTFTEVLFPCLHKVGMMWHTGAIDVSTEHFITAIFRQRLIAAIDGLPHIGYYHNKRVMMFLPEGEFHELGLLFYCYVFRKKGYRTLYLGQSVPLETLRTAIDKWNPEILVTGTETELNIRNPGEYLRGLSGGNNKIKILAGGRLAEHAEILKIRNVFPIRNEKDIEE